MFTPMISTSSDLVFLAAPMWNAATWISMMGEAFKVADRERAELAVNGPWTARTGNIQRYARVDVYA